MINNRYKASFLIMITFINLYEIKKCLQNSLSMFNQAPVHKLCLFQFLKFFDQSVIAQNCTGKTKSICCSSAHIFYKAMFHFLKHNIQSLPLLWVCMKFIIVDGYLFLRKNTCNIISLSPSTSRVIVIKVKAK